MSRKYQIPIIAITGSTGKTTTKECIAAILKQRWNIIKTFKNNNLPISTLKNRKRITASTKAAVLEYAMALPNDLIRHCRVLKPSISVITNIGSAHIGLSQSSVERLARNKSNIILGMQPDGLLLVNADDDNSTHLLVDQHTGQLITIGIDMPSTYQAKNVEVYEKGSIFDVNIKGEWHTFTLNLLGRHNIYNALFAIAVADYLGFTVEEIKKGLEVAFINHLRFSRRLSVYELSNNITLIDDTKNANPHACKAAIDVVKQMKKDNYITVFGDMLHLGAYTQKGHYEVGEYAAMQQVNKLIAYGKYAKYIKQGALDQGMPPENIVTFSRRIDLHRYFLSTIKSNSVVLIKGSGAINMSKTVNFLLLRLRSKVKR